MQLQIRRDWDKPRWALSCTIIRSRLFRAAFLSHSLKSRSRTTLSSLTWRRVNIASNRIYRSTHMVVCRRWKRMASSSLSSTAILNYLEAIWPAPALVPPDARDRALVDMHMKLCDLQLTRHAGTIIFPKRFLPKERWNTSAMADAKAEIEKHLMILDKQLAGKTYLVAEQFSLAEVCYMPFLDFLPLMEIDPPPVVASWSQRLLARPSAVATRPEK